MTDTQTGSAHEGTSTAGQAAPPSDDEVDPTVHPDDRFDVVVIGSGPGGYVAAGRAGQLGLRTAVIERGELGGICLNWGCIPTKALLHGAEVARTIRSGADVGVSAGEPSIDVDRLVAHSRSTAERLSSGVAALMADRGVEVIRGRAVLSGKGEVAVDTGSGTRRLLAEHVIVAAGARARGLPGIEPDGERIWTYREALVPSEVPASLVVIGSGAIGSEFASLYSELGATVTLLEALPRIMPGESPAVSRTVARSFARRGLAAHAGVTVHGAQAGPDGVVVRFADAGGAEKELSADRLLLAVGVQPNTEGLGLEELGVLDDHRFVRVDGHGRTGVWGLYAIGDVTGGPCLAHKASGEALRCVDALAGVDRAEPEEDWRSWVPRCTYTFPEVASIGLSAQKAADAGYDVVSRPIRFSENGRALGTGSTEGFAEVLVDRADNAVLGATLVGEGVTELIGMLVLAHAAGADAETFVRAVLPHPTRGEAVRESVLAALGRPVDSI